MKYAQIEMMDFEAYKGGALAVDIIAFMEQNGFKEIGRELSISCRIRITER